MNDSHENVSQVEERSELQAIRFFERELYCRIGCLSTATAGADEFLISASHEPAS
jgi:hypothetical protein